MSLKKFDPIDAALWILTLMTSFMIVGIGSFDLFGVQFSEDLFTIAGIGLSTAWVLSYGGVVGTILTNDNAQLSELGNDLSKLDDYYYYAAVGTLGLPVAFVVLPDMVGSFFQSADLWGLVYVAIVATGQAALGWML